MLDDLLADLTDDQRAAVVHGEGPLLILAGAGSGKTRVITRRVAHLLRSGVRGGNILAITFTNKAAGEMRKRIDELVPGNRLWICTFHSLGARLLRMYADRLQIDRNFTIYDVDDRNKLVKDALDATGMDNAKFTPDRLGGAISKAKNQLLTPKQYEQQAHDFFSKTVANVYMGYEKRLRAANGMDFDDLLYLPALALRHNEELRAELDARFRYVLIDEYQDTNLAQYEIARRLSLNYPNLCVVGDPDQCLMPGTKVETPTGPMSIESVRDGDVVTTCIGWGKIGSRTVDKVMMSPFAGRIVSIRTSLGQTIRATSNHVCFARLQPDESRHYVYLMYKKGVGYRLGTTRGVRTSKDAVLMSGLQVRTNQEVADAVWIVKSCADDGEARFHEQLLSVKFGIPTMVFFVRGRRMAITQDHIDRLYSEIDSTAAAKRLMAEFLIDSRYPHHRPGAVVRNEIARRHVIFTMFGSDCAKSEGRAFEHRIQLVTTGDELRGRCEVAGLPVRSGQRGTWRIETARADVDDGMAFVQRIADIDNFDIVPRARLSESKAYHFMPAVHLHPGMVVPVRNGDRIEDATIEAVEWEDYSGPVYDLSVPKTHNFIANGIVVHNSIYKWRGSDIKNIMDFERDFPNAKVITLQQNYRSTKAILRAASAVIDHNKHRKKKTLVTDNPAGEAVRVLTYNTGLDEAEGVVTRIKDAVKAGRQRYRDAAIFVRINALTRTLESAFLKHGVPFQIVRGLAFYERKETRDVLAYLRLLVNPNDTVSFLRAVNEPARGIGKTSLERLIAFAERSETSLMQATANVAQVPEIKGKAATGLRDFYRMMAELRAQLELPPHELIRLVLDKSGYRKMLADSKDDDDADRLANIEELITAAKQFHDEDESRTLSDFLEQVSLASDVDGWDEAADAVNVMTLHSAKGLEFPVVYVLAVEQGILPHDRSLAKEEDIEEERRLCFVGMTRAMRELNLCYARLRDFRGQALYQVPSMFLDELPEDAKREDADPGRNFARSAIDEWRVKAGYSGANTVPAPVEPRRDPPTHGEYKEGAMVQHDEYGIGQITNISGFGALRRMKVRFATAGEKTFVADKVTMKVVSRKQT